MRGLRIAECAVTGSAQSDPAIPIRSPQSQIGNGAARLFAVFGRTASFIFFLIVLALSLVHAHVPVRDIQFHLQIEGNTVLGECYWVVGDRRWVYDLRDRADVNFDGKIDDFESEALRKFLWDRLSSSISFRSGRLRIPLKAEKTYAGGLSDPVGSAYPITLRIVLQKQTFNPRKPLILASTHPSSIYVKWKDPKGADHEAIVDRGVITLYKPRA